MVIVTGGGRGLGKTYSESLAQAGAAIVVADRDRSAAQEVAMRINGAGGKATAAAVDIASEAEAARLADAAIEAFGRIDGLVNNAALMSSLPRRPWHEIPVSEWDEVMAVNLRGMFLCCRAVFPQMKKQRSGSIVNISSSRVFEGTAHRLHYTTSKAGVIGFTRALARELGEHLIRVNCIAPGLTLSETQVAASDAAYLAKASEGRSLVRAQVPEDLVGSMMFLLSDASGFITGQTLNVDGGKVMH